MRYKTLCQTLILGCLSLTALLAQATAPTMSELNYQDADPGAAPYRTRILVTPDYLRMDAGDDKGDFALLNRANGELLNVIRSERRAYRYQTRKIVLAKPQPWKITQIVKQLAPTTRQFIWSVNGKPCGQITAAVTLLPDTARALQQYWRALVPSQSQTWQHTPAELRNECDLARYVFEIPRLFQYGLPLEDIASDGRTRHYESDRQVPLQMDLFRVPKDYQLIKLTN